MNFDQILSAIDGFGRYQKILYIWICLPQILLAFHMMVSIFTGATPPFHCKESSTLGENQTDAPSGNLSDSPCFSSEVMLLQGNRTERVPCGQGWVYSRETFQSTTVTEVSMGWDAETRQSWSLWVHSIEGRPHGRLWCKRLHGGFFFLGAPSPPETTSTLTI